MPVRKAIAEKDGIYFITFTCTNWMPLFKICNAYDAVYNWFSYLKAQGHHIIGYVIMPSHVHVVIALLFRNVSSKRHERKQGHCGNRSTKARSIS